MTIIAAFFTKNNFLTDHFPILEYFLSSQVSTHFLSQNYRQKQEFLFSMLLWLKKNQY